ncbi:MAG: hypothetical protein AABY22_10620 [Nanoarchaeota archaeon]
MNNLGKQYISEINNKFEELSIEDKKRYKTLLNDFKRIGERALRLGREAKIYELNADSSSNTISEDLIEMARATLKGDFVHAMEIK